MTIETLTSFFGWCAAINFGLLLISVLVLSVARKPIEKIHTAITGLDEATLRRIYFQYLSLYKIVWISLNLAPYVALRMIGAPSA